MRFRVLGPVQVRAGDQPVPLPAGHSRVVLALLALYANTSVSVQRLTEAAWDGRPPATSRTQIHGVVSMLRRALAGLAEIVTEANGYLLRVPRGDCDAPEFLVLLDRARRAQLAGDSATVVEVLDRALALWRGPAFGGLPSGLLAAEAARLDEARLTAVALHARAELDLGRCERATARLIALVEQHPLHERLRELLMLALYQAGRRAEALAVFQQGRRALVEELGVEPGPGLQDLHRHILRGQPGPQGHATGPHRLSVVPRQVPAAVPDLAGRQDELTRLTGLLDRAGTDGRSVVIAAIDGAAGVGKTTLAVYWAHQMAGAFPDGQLYVDLRGDEPDVPPVPPGQAVRGFLDALEVPAPRIPSDLSAQSALYRSVLAGKRMLVLLDNARDAEQIRPLLPGAPGSVVVVTSRTALTGLIAAHGAHPVTLDPLSGAEAHDLLAARLGDNRLAAEPAATADLISLCARLPWALSVVAARAAVHPGTPLATFAAELREAQHQGATPDASNPASDLDETPLATGPLLPPLPHGFGADPTRVQPVTDRTAALAAALETGPEGAVVVVGSPSFGPTDHVHPLLADLGAALHVDGVACRPGERFSRQRQPAVRRARSGSARERRSVRRGAAPPPSGRRGTS
ncbi:MAG TPA: AfsR/SARP family transcriptional regulator [Rugosimonospora sp.]|nr:AfsR/SARP family transcriptional regulator [Rugosimonospora sp.]